MPSHKKPQSGSILALTLVVMVVGITIYLTISSTLLVHLNWAARWGNREIAEHNAKSAINTAIGEIRHDLSYEEDVKIDFGDEGAGGTGVLTFDPDKGIPWSANNAQGQTTVEGWDGPENLSTGQVFPRMVKLVGVGECRGSRCVMEALLGFPQFPYALASSGPIQAEGKLEVLGVDSLADTVDGVTEDEKRRGHIVSNSTDANAIVLNPDVKVTGDVQAVGYVIENGAQVEGNVVSTSTPFPILDMGLDRPPGPDPNAGLYINDFNPDNFSENKLSEDFALVNNASDTYKVSELRVKIDTGGQTLFINNGLELSDGLLWIDGDVVIRGGIHGTGAVMATGKITVIGPSSLDSDTTALVSGGGITLNGQGLDRSRFRGLVATLGDFQADSAQIEGAFVAAGVDPKTNLGTSKMVLEDVRVVQAPDATKMNLDVHEELKAVLDDGQGKRFADGSQIGLKLGDKFYTFTGDPSLSDTERKAQVQTTYQALKASQDQIDSGSYPFSSGTVMIQKADGSYDSVPDTWSGGEAVERAAVGLRRNWDSYSQSISDTTIQPDVDSILNIDLSKFTSGTSRTIIMYYIET
jgi:cytoskeletal protein CcmA (bactofilin family)